MCSYGLTHLYLEEGIPSVTLLTQHSRDRRPAERHYWMSHGRGHHDRIDEDPTTSYTSIMSPLPIVINEVDRRNDPLAGSLAASSIAPCLESPSAEEFVHTREDILVVTDKGVRIQYGPMGSTEHDDMSYEEVNINHNSTRSSWSYADFQRRAPQVPPAMTPVHSEHNPDDLPFRISNDAKRRRGNTMSYLEESPRAPSTGSFGSRWRNSFFAFRLISSSAVLLVVAAACLTLHELSKKKHHWCPNMVDATKYSRIVVISSLVEAILVVPALIPSYCGLYRVSETRKVIRRPFLQICEIVVVAQMVVYGVQLILWIFRMVEEQPSTCGAKEKHFESTDKLIIYVKLWSILPIGVLLWWQITVFCLFRTHLKLQIGSANDSKHSANLKGWLKRLFTLPAFGRRNKIIRQLRTDLFKAAMTGDVVSAEQLLEQSVRLLGREFASKKLYHEPRMWLWAFARSRKNPLHVAVARSDIAMIELFMKYRFDVNARDKVSRVNFNFGLFFKWTRLMVKTQDFMQPPADSMFVTVFVTPLQVAVQNGHIEAVRTLLKHNADVDKLPRASFYHQSAVKPPIFFADHVQVMKLLLAHQTNLLYVQTHGARVVTPLQRNVLTFRTTQANLLEEYGSDVALTPLHTAAAADDHKRVESLVRSGLDPDVLGELVAGFYQRTPLHWAAISGSANSARHLLAHGANPMAVDRFGRTPLHWAARNNHVQVVQLLLEYKADANAMDSDGYPVLCVAAQAEGVSVEVIGLLVSAGADLAFKDRDGNTPLHIALINENRQTAVSLLRNNADIMATNLAGQRAVDCTTSTELQFAVKKEAGSRDVMISYTHARSHVAKAVRDYLVGEHARMTCWMDTMDPSGIGGGAVWREEIARGIYNAKVVVAVVCDGYSRSEWCLKELAFARLARTPAVVLVVDPNGMSSEVERYVSSEFILPFGDFNPDAPAFPDHIVSTIRTAMQSKGMPLVPAITTVIDGNAPYRRVLICFSAKDSFVDRICYSLQSRGYIPVAATKPLSDMDFTEGPDADALLASSTVVFVLGPNWNQKANFGGLERALSQATQCHKRIVPIVVGDQCLDFSRLYSLSRTLWYPFLDGVAFDASFDYLATHLSLELPLMKKKKEAVNRASHGDASFLNFYDDDASSSVSSAFV
ncbi:hypothetical protein Ae201684P_005396 [Aphanomyces euteiches]|uniref:TIR domain-containing protein n=1 Tax=Aphanomyces euteiches TaxID=100861 RepID=A0A6G0X4H6_9STRA|nr:hypothetical protein Ae201684_008532 [Aphanomyces euteiches]KAH9085693.1 hypothetical protein Ae201684P_005396 [Aphanomyces euteiches]KAH9143605.1 hypothetical protein AeRB84_012398 [Aphanomyces euteiches]